jgi:cysteine desulfurase
MQPIYLDHNATTPLLPEVAHAMAECQRTAFANPESQHQLGRRARQVLEDAREGIARILGAELTGPHPDRLIFTSGGTEANNLAILGLAAGGVESSAESQAAGSATTPTDFCAGRMIISAIEHPSVSRPAEVLAHRGWRLDRLGVSVNGVVRRDEFATMLADSASSLGRIGVASVMLANNETGIIQPVGHLAELARAANVPLHTDAAQIVGKLPVNFRRLGVAALTCAAHKFHGPRGIGALLLADYAKLEPVLWGGFHQQGLRPGTECVALAVGMHKALEIFDRDEEQRRDEAARLRDRFEMRVRSGWPDLVVHGAEVDRLPNTTNISFPGLDRQALVMALDLAGVACSTGSACASGSSEPSPTLRSMGLPEALVESSLRFSLGATTTEQEIDAAADCVVRICKQLRPRSQARF